MAKNKSIIGVKKARKLARKAARASNLGNTKQGRNVKSEAIDPIAANQDEGTHDFAAKVMSRRPAPLVIVQNNEAVETQAAEEPEGVSAVEDDQGAEYQSENIDPLDAEVAGDDAQDEQTSIDVENEEQEPASEDLSDDTESHENVHVEDVEAALPEPSDPPIEAAAVVAPLGNGRAGNGNKGTLGPKARARMRREQLRAVAQVEVRSQPVVDGVRFKFRHFMVLMSFLLMVVCPSAGIYWYLNERAADQYISTIGFSVRKEEVGSAVDVLGSISQISAGSSSDTDILYEFIQSQEQVVLVDERLDLRQIYTKPENDPLFALVDDASTEELIDYWNRMVKVFYNGSNGLIQIRVHAFEAEDARDIAEAIFEESSLMINKLSAIARADATRYAKDELDLAVERLKVARAAITTFRNETQIVDPKTDLQGQMGLINNLQEQLAAAIIEQDLLLQTTKENDPRNTQAERKVEVIRNRIASERKKFGAGGEESAGAYSTLIARFEGLAVEQEFAEQFYVSALQTYDAARAEAQRISRYLAAYVTPTLAQTPQYPRRWMIFGLVTFFAFLIWSIVVMVGYSVRSRK